jgi:hypothetical membrane protein
VASERFTRLWLVCGMAAPAALMAVVIVLGQTTPDYSPVSQTISTMGMPGRRYALVLNGSYALYGVAMGLAAFGLFRSTILPQISRRGAVLLAVHAVGTVLLGVFADSSTSLARHVAHDVVSAVSYLPLLGIILVFHSAARRLRALMLVGIVGLLVVALNVPMPTVTLFHPYSGLLQRVLAGPAYCWLAGAFGLLYWKRHQLWGHPTGSG